MPKAEAKRYPRILSAILVIKLQLYHPIVYVALLHPQLPSCILFQLLQKEVTSILTNISV